MTRLPRHYAAARGSFAGEAANAARDFASAAVANASLWSALAWNDILARYRGSILGPFWITLTSAAFAIGVGLVYSDLMGADPTIYVRWIAVSVVLWNLFAVSLQEGCDTFIQSGALIRQTALPLPVFPIRTVLRNLLVFLHQAVVIIAVNAYYKDADGVMYLMHMNLPMFFVGFIIMVLNISWLVLFVGIIAARFRDFPQVISTILQLAFFLSPVIWIPKDTMATRPFLELNPIYHMLDITRAPLLGQPSNPNSFVIMLVLAAVGWAVTFGLFSVTRRRIVHYL